MTTPSHPKISALMWLGGVFALSAEAAVMAALMIIAGVLAVGWGLIGTCAPNRRRLSH
jgi:hypothetical protein